MTDLIACAVAQRSAGEGGVKGSVNDLGQGVRAGAEKFPEVNSFTQEGIIGHKQINGGCVSSPDALLCVVLLQTSGVRAIARETRALARSGACNKLRSPTVSEDIPISKPGTDGCSSLLRYHPAEARAWSSRRTRKTGCAHRMAASHTRTS